MSLFTQAQIEQLKKEAGVDPSTSVTIMETGNPPTQIKIHSQDSLALMQIARYLRGTLNIRRAGVNAEAKTIKTNTGGGFPHLALEKNWQSGRGQGKEDEIKTLYDHLNKLLEQEAKNKLDALLRAAKADVPPPMFVYHSVGYNKIVITKDGKETTYNAPKRDVLARSEYRVDPQVTDPLLCGLLIYFSQELQKNPEAKEITYSFQPQAPAAAAIRTMAYAPAAAVRSQPSSQPYQPIASSNPAGGVQPQAEDPLQRPVLLCEPISANAPASTGEPIRQLLPEVINGLRAAGVTTISFTKETFTLCTPNSHNNLALRLYFSDKKKRDEYLHQFPDSCLGRDYVDFAESENLYGFDAPYIYISVGDYLVHVNLENREGYLLPPGLDVFYMHYISNREALFQQQSEASCVARIILEIPKTAPVVVSSLLASQPALRIYPAPPPPPPLQANLPAVFDLHQQFVYQQQQQAQHPSFYYPAPPPPPLCVSQSVQAASQPGFNFDSPAAPPAPLPRPSAVPQPAPVVSAAAISSAASSSTSTTASSSSQSPLMTEADMWRSLNNRNIQTISIMRRMLDTLVELIFKDAQEKATFYRSITPFIPQKARVSTLSLTGLQFSSSWLLSLPTNSAAVLELKDLRQLCESYARNAALEEQFFNVGDKVASSPTSAQPSHARSHGAPAPSATAVTTSSVTAAASAPAVSQPQPAAVAAASSAAAMTPPPAIPVVASSSVYAPAPITFAGSSTQPQVMSEQQMREKFKAARIKTISVDDYPPPNAGEPTNDRALKLTFKNETPEDFVNGIAEYESHFLPRDVKNTYQTNEQAKEAYLFISLSSLESLASSARLIILPEEMQSFYHRYIAGKSLAALEAALEHSFFVESAAVPVARSAP